MLAWQDFAGLADEAERVLLTTHVRPDGDALGCVLAMADLLNQKGKEVEIFVPSPTPPRYRFLDPDGTKLGFPKEGVGLPRSEPDLLMVLDTGTWSQLAGLADYVRRSPARKVVLDHHESQDDLGAVRFVDSSAPACGLLVFDAFRELRGELTPVSAEALFVAIAMDTGWFRHSNSTREVFQAAATLVAAGARPNVIYRNLFESNSPARYRLLRFLLDRLELLVEGRLAASYILQEDIRACGAHPMDTEDFINYPMSIEGVETALLFVEQRAGGTKVSFRTRSALDCSKLAEQFGGGGHRPAAGATLELPIAQARERVLHATTLAMTTS